MWATLSDEERRLLILQTAYDQDLKEAHIPSEQPE
jgi:hypothetical protein